MGELSGLGPRLGAGAQCATPLPHGSLSRLESGARPDNELLPDSVLPRARSILGLAGRVVCHAWPEAMPAFVAISRRVRRGPLTEYAWDRLFQWATYLAKPRDAHLAVRKAVAGTDAACFSDSSALNGPILGSSYAGACIQFSTGDPARPGTAMSGEIWAWCLVPPSPETAPPRRSSSWRSWRPRRSWRTGFMPGG